MNYPRLRQLKDLIMSGKATSAEKQEFMEMLHSNGNITLKQLNQFEAGKYKNDFLRIGSVIAGALILVRLLEELAKTTTEK